MKACFKCGEGIEPSRATWLADLLDKFMEFLPEPFATNLGDGLIAGRLPDECFDVKDGIERVLLCDSCTLTIVNTVLTS